MIAEDTSYGSSVMSNTVDELESIGWTTISEDSIALDRSNFTSLLSRIKSNDPDVVWHVGTSSSTTGSLVSQFRDQQFEETHFMSNFGMTVDAAREGAGAAGDGVITTIIPTAIPAYLEETGMQPAWEDEYGGRPSGSAASSYQNVLLTTTLANAAGGPSAFPGIDIGEWESAVIDHDPIQGACGVYDWEDNHQAKWGTVDTQPGIAYQVVDQELIPFWPEELTDEEIDASVY
jgi:ABC-type branched-subunit amino acid transport system substrate-binding protein